MTLPLDFSNKSTIVTITGIAVIALCSYKIWHGRKVSAKINDEDNPALWYLKDPNKYRKQL